MDLRARHVKMLALWEGTPLDFREGFCLECRSRTALGSAGRIGLPVPIRWRRYPSPDLDDSRKREDNRRCACIFSPAGCLCRVAHRSDSGITRGNPLQGASLRTTSRAPLCGTRPRTKIVLLPFETRPTLFQQSRSLQSLSCALFCRIQGVLPVLASQLKKPVDS